VSEIVFDSVRFRYPRGSLALRRIHLTIRRKERIALVGPNGSGKTTLINLLLRFYDPKKGQIRFDGTDLRDVRLRELRDRVSVVAQHTTLFDDTLFNNIRYGSPHATRQQVEQAAKDAFAHEFIQGELNEGYETVLGERGCRLSGGQRQRIALARAFLRDPELLILDEATSSIDMESEKLIYDAIDRNRKDCTVLIVNHRLTALPFVNRIIVMDAGRIIRDGSREEVCEVLGWSNWSETTQEVRSRKSA
jgi:ATP-binding cassette subfamily B protein/subfamily B ATP-binding cassette protein MsbA